MSEKDGILFERRGSAGVITLARPETLNAVTDAMLTALSAHLDEWEQDASVEKVIIKAVPGRAFSAGGDIRHLYERGMAGDYDYDFFAREYALNARIHHYPKPYIALIDGIVMGGGVGVSFHGSHRVAGDDIAFAMPEVGIGFFPDVGGSYLLSRLPGHLGEYLGLTGARFGQADCVATGLATHSCPSEDMDELEQALCEAENISSVLNTTQTDAKPTVEKLLPWLDETFSGPTVESVVEKLLQISASDDAKGQWAARTLSLLDRKSPTSLKIAFSQIRRGRSMTMNDCMLMEYRILRRILSEADFYEGIRATIIEKDNAPAWQPPTLEDVSDEHVSSYFAELGEKELVLA